MVVCITEHTIQLAGTLQGEAENKAENCHRHLESLRTQLAQEERVQRGAGSKEQCLQEALLHAINSLRFRTFMGGDLGG